MFKPNQIPARERIDFEEAETLRRLGALFRMERRSRPRYFDGRFLAARDLIRDQAYFLARQTDLGRGIGSGVVTGLTVSARAGLATELVIAPGHGLTPAGEMVALTAPLRVRLADLPAAQRLDAAFGIRLLPNDPPRNRSGVFILALRPIEYSANPIAAYPTQIEGPRGVEDRGILRQPADGRPAATAPGARGLARGRVPVPVDARCRCLVGGLADAVRHASGGLRRQRIRSAIEPGRACLA